MSRVCIRASVHLRAGLNELSCVYSQGLDDLLSLPWVDCTTSPPSGTSSRLLVEAHEALNEWYDGFLFEDAAERLAWMGEQA